MLSKRVFQWVHKLAIFAMLVASLAPALSHALTAHSDGKSFIQEICTANGTKILINVVTTQGKQLQAALQTKPGTQPVSIHHQTDHCPFCLLSDHAPIAFVFNDALGFIPPLGTAQIPESHVASCNESKLFLHCRSRAPPPQILSV